ncbi:pre-RNA processing PIH1/Nop17-domain-containing protein [Amylocystis lapponica]|nr:pre-RNA processing PIH1/Nop17-domain-containing protein [Amylocystis lapponica]
MHTGTVSVALAPSPGFCINMHHYHPPASRTRLDRPTVVANTITIPVGLKVFVNVAWDTNVPPPPHGSEDAIQHAMHAHDALADANPEDWFVPVLVSEPREDRDKAGKPSAVFDCVYNASLKSRTLRDPEFKTFLIELAFQRIEAQTALVLSREIGTPNIPAKGTLLRRTVLIPAALYPDGHPLRPSTSAAVSLTEKPHQKQRGGNLIQEIDPNVSQPVPPTGADRPKGIFKGPPATNETGAPLTTPSFSWLKTGDTLCVRISVPNLTHADIPRATLDLEHRRLVLRAPPRYALDLDLDLPDAQIAVRAGLDDPSARQALALKRARDFDVDRARAEWRVAEGVLAVLA